MLISAQIKNFLSYKEDKDGNGILFSMIGGKVRSKSEHLYRDHNLKVLKFSALYGANASGKSNLIKAIKFIQSSLIEGLPDNADDLYCKMDPDGKDKPSEFSIKFLLGKDCYQYLFRIILSKKSIIEESLFELYPERQIFYRNTQTGEFRISQANFNSELRERFLMYAEDVATDDTVLFLRLINRNKESLYERYPEVSFFREIYRWFQSKLYVGLPDEPVSDYSYLVRPDKKELTKEALVLIRRFSTGITDCKIVEVPVEKVLGELPSNIRTIILKRLKESVVSHRRKGEKGSAALIMRNRNRLFVITMKDDEEQPRCRTIKFLHGVNSPMFNLSEESDGTVRLFDLLDLLLDTDDKTFFIDEFDRSLHPALSHELIKMFLENTKHKNTQLIVTTHDTELMNLDLLRRDEIWFADKMQDNTTNLYSMEKFKTRFDKDIRRAYLDGTYGAIPKFE